jgi:putative phosphoesterase
MQIAVIADTHMPRGGRTLPPECVRRLCEADLILHAGDVVGAGFLEELHALGPPLEAVYGNMDEPALKAALPEEHVVEAGEARIGLVHLPGSAAGRAERLRSRFPGCDAVVYGHTHVPEIARVGGTWILNPGSPTERRRAPVRSLLSLEVLGVGNLRPTLVTLAP